MQEQNNLITICTPTYNRAHLIHRPFQSLLNQTDKRFVWLIIDDGSTDNTEEIIQEFKLNAPFEIEYYKKENGGRHTALNYSYDKIKTKYVMNLDSDDELVSDCIEKIYKIYNEMPKDDRFWLISGRCIDNISNKLIGKKWPDNINELKGTKQRKLIYSINGEKANCRRVDILKKFPFPTENGIKFVGENTVWELVDKYYDQYCVNDVFQKYFIDSADGICSGGMHSDFQRESQLNYCIFCINNLLEEIGYNKNVQKSIINFSRCCILTKKSFFKTLGRINSNWKKIILVLFYPIGGIMSVLYKRKK